MCYRMKTETVNEKLIQEAAEEEFLSKGYAGAKTTSIARKAGVTHAMLHYYYRTKENLFQKVFQEKVQMIANSFEVIFDEALPFEEIIKSFIEKHFDFLIQNPGLINFVQNEIRVNKENGIILRNILFAKMNYIFNRFEKILDKEISEGTIKPIKPIELFTNILSLNLSTAIIISITGEMIMFNQDFKPDDIFLKQRKENNVQYILYSLRV